MLEHLEIKNFALIENLSIDFHEGFNVISGETGSGKSIILGALGLLMGEKADASAIRNGADEITVNALISIPEDHEILPWLKERDVQPEDGAIIVKRTVRANGRSVITVQGQMFTRSDLTFLSDSLIDMHGQSEHQSLLLPDRQRKIVDAYADDREILNKTATCYHNITLLRKQKEDIEKQLEEGRRQEDYLGFALDEIESAHIRENEDEELKEKVLRLGQFETIYENLNSCCEKLKEIKALEYDASSYLAKAGKCDSALSDYIARLESSRIENEDIAQGLRSYISSVDYSEDAVNQMQERLSQLQKLKRKYGPSLKDVLAFAEDAKAKLDICRNSEVHLDKCEKELLEAESEYVKNASQLSKKRTSAAQKLEKQIENTLRTLGMPNAMFAIRVENNSEKISAAGNDSIVFMISANPGEEMKEMREIASGGELSRVMLALKTVLAKADSIQTQVFDEVDSGIGGSVALNLANCIRALSKDKQVIAITHLATIASKADSQFVVSKSVENGRTYSHLKQVEGEARVLEIARMLSGDESALTVEHAKALLADSKN